jgi:hypothetical protein
MCSLQQQPSTQSTVSPGFISLNIIVTIRFPFCVPCVVMVADPLKKMAGEHLHGGAAFEGGQKR